MVTASFLQQDGPLELLQEILFHSESVKDVYLFSIVCKRMRNAWLSNNYGRRTAWAVVVSKVPAAEQALVAVRSLGKTPSLFERANMLSSNSTERLKMPSNVKEDQQRRPNLL